MEGNAQSGNCSLVVTKETAMRKGFLGKGKKVQGDWVNHLYHTETDRPCDLSLIVATAYKSWQRHLEMQLRAAWHTHFLYLLPLSIERNLMSHLRGRETDIYKKKKNHL